jgi:probable rRNA maturation factor
LLEVDLQFGPGVGPAHRKVFNPRFVRKWLALALSPEVQQAVLTVRVVGTAEGRSLNHQYRGKDYATNVLTFDYQRAPVLMADLVLCAPVLASESRSLGKPLAEHAAHLLVHGCLHAQAYDHETSERDAALMESLESLLLLSAGQPDPYL